MRFLTIVIAVWFPVMAWAEQVVVRSGEHADFSRLVFEFQGAVKWEMGRVEKGYEIRIGKPGVTFDISDVFRRIPRDRIQRLNISQDNTRITLALGCECHADAFEFRPGMLVVDVKDGLPDSTSRFESAFHSGEISQAQPGNAETSNQVEIVDNPKPPTTTPKEEQRARLAKYFSRPNQPDTEESTASDAFSKEFENPAILPTGRVAEMQSVMLRQIGRAASQGLLESKLSRTIQGASSSRESSDDIADTIAPAPPHPHINLHIESSVDHAFMGLIPEKELTDDGAVCMSDQAFNIVEWGNSDSIFEQITVQRGKLTGEFDKADKQAVLALIRAYIYAGFGVEAQKVLSSFDLSLKDAAILKVMAQIVDGRPVRQETLFQGQTGCDGLVALWAVLASPGLSKATAVNRAAVLRAFSNLPYHLRKNLGPALAQKFLDIGDAETTRALRNAIARSAGNAGPEFHLLEARLNQKRGLHKEAEQALEEIVSQNSSISPIGLIDLLEVKLEQDVEIGENFLVIAESYIFEQQNTELGDNLERLLALARAKSGDYIAALDLLRKLEPSEHLDKDMIGRTWGRVLEMANSTATDEAFLRFIFTAQSDLGSQKISRNIRRQAASRLLDNGLVVIANKLLLTPVSPTTDDRILLARAALISNDAERAIGYLEHVSGNVAKALRANAYEMWGKPLEAGHEYGQMPDQEKQMRAYWRAGDWARLNEMGSGAEKAAAQIMITRSTNDNKSAPAGEQVIRQGKELIKASEATRHTIELLLEENPAPIRGKS